MICSNLRVFIKMSTLLRCVWGVRVSDGNEYPTRGHWESSKNSHKFLWQEKSSLLEVVRLLPVLCPFFFMDKINLNEVLVT